MKLSDDNIFTALPLLLLLLLTLYELFFLHITIATAHIK